MKTRQQVLAAAALAFAAITPALAQVKCSMPNQKVITLQTASRCPPDALKAETLDGRDITPPASQPATITTSNKRSTEGRDTQANREPYRQAEERRVRRAV